MFQFGRGDKTKVVLAYYLLRVAYDTAHSLSILHKVELKN